MKPKLIIISCTNPVEGKRQKAFQKSAASMIPLAIELEWIDYQMLIDNPNAAIDRLNQADYIKWDTPGENRQLYTFFAQQGWQTQARGKYPDGYLGYEIPDLDLWFLGFRDFLQKWAAIGKEHQWHWLNTPQAILTLTDKWQFQQHMELFQQPIPPLLGLIKSYDDLQERMQQTHCQRVFVKARYGSSAAGVFAYQKNSRHQEILQCCLERVNGRWFYSKKIRKITDHPSIVETINAFAPMGLYAERWIAKPLLSQQEHFDIRILTLFGKPEHRVARASRKVFTNLHLDGERILSDTPELSSYFKTAEAVATNAAKTLPSAGLIGWDIIVRPNHAFILEGNAFGDYLPKLFFNEQDSYQSQIATLAHRIIP